MLKKTVLLSVVIGALALGVMAASAQGRGGNAGGRGTPGNCTGDCGDPQTNAYQFGGMGFQNPGNGGQWNEQQRGQMNRGSGQNGVGFYTSLPPAFDGELPQDVIDMMISGWLDEQNAWAIYESVIGQFGENPPLVNIQRAESQHVAAWEFLFERYGIEVPEIPTVDVPEFASVTDACQAAADAEIANFGLYDEMLAAFEAYPDLYQVTLALRNASEFNHLPAFETCAAR